MKLQKKEQTGRDGEAAPVACIIMEDSRNRLKGIGLYSGMRLLLGFALVMIPMQAMSLKDFNAKAPAEQSSYVASFIEKMSGDLGAKNPELGQAIRDWFTKKAAGKPVSEGMEKLYVELTALELQARDGKADLSKLQLESVIVYLVKQKFQPHNANLLKAMPRILHAAA